MTGFVSESLGRQNLACACDLIESLNLTSTSGGIVGILIHDTYYTSHDASHNIWALGFMHKCIRCLSRYIALCSILNFWVRHPHEVSIPSFSNMSYARILISSPQIVPATSLSDKIVAEIQKCLSDTYVIISQPGVNAADYHSHLSVPHLRQMISGDIKAIRSSLSVTDVIGNINSERFGQVAEDACGARSIRMTSSGKFGD